MEELSEDPSTCVSLVSYVVAEGTSLKRRGSSVIGGDASPAASRFEASPASGAVPSMPGVASVVASGVDSPASVPPPPSPVPPDPGDPPPPVPAPVEPPADELLVGPGCESELVPQATSHSAVTLPRIQRARYEFRRMCM